jgi:phage protein D
MTAQFSQPTFLIEIEGKGLSRDITQEITSFVFTDNESELDTLELTISDRNLQFVDDPLFQEGNQIVARFGYSDNLSARKKTVIKEIDYDYPENGAPAMRIKAFDKGYKLAGKVNQKVWHKPAPGILYSEIAESIAASNGLRPVVTPTKGRHLRVVQSNQSDAQFLKELAAKSRANDGDGTTGYAFFVQDDELHFHPRDLDKAPQASFEYFTAPNGLLCSFRVNTHTQGAKGAGVETKTVGVDPRAKGAVEYKANNATTPDRPVLGKKTFLVDGNTGEMKFSRNETGAVLPSFDASETLHERSLKTSAQDIAEGSYRAAEMKQAEAIAVTVGMPTLQAKKNIEIKGVGLKFSGIWYCQSVRHSIGSDGYRCELQLRKNALGKGAGSKAGKAEGKVNANVAPNNPEKSQPAMIRFDANTGKRL